MQALPDGHERRRARFGSWKLSVRCPAAARSERAHRPLELGGLEAYPRSLVSLGQAAGLSDQSSPSSSSLCGASAVASGRTGRCEAVPPRERDRACSLPAHRAALLPASASHALPLPEGTVVLVDRSAAQDEAVEGAGPAPAGWTLRRRGTRTFALRALVSSSCATLHRSSSSVRAFRLSTARTTSLRREWVRRSDRPNREREPAQSSSQARPARAPQHDAFAWLSTLQGALSGDFLRS